MAKKAKKAVKKGLSAESRKRMGGGMVRHMQAKKKKAVAKKKRAA